MKSVATLMMAAFTILSVSVYAQDTTKQNVTKQETEKNNLCVPDAPRCDYGQIWQMPKMRRYIIAKRKDEKRSGGSVRMSGTPRRNK